MNLPFYLELNDDALIQALSSGAFTGVPETHNIQMLFPGRHSASCWFLGRFFFASGKVPTEWRR